MNDTIRIGVLLGGVSNEREISLESGRNIIYKLSPAQYTVVPLFLSSSLELHSIDQRILVCNTTKEIEQALTPSMRIGWSDLSTHVDFVFIGLHGGIGENGSVQGALEMLGIPYNGSSVFASALCMDKYRTNQFLKAKGFDVPEHVFFSKEEWLLDSQAAIKKISSHISFPLIIKPHDDGCSVLVQKVHNTQELEQGLNTLFERKQYALVEACISGMELTVGVVGNHRPQALPPSRCVAVRDVLSTEEKFLPGAGENQTPAPLPEQVLIFIQQTIERVFMSVGCRGYARIDCFYQNEEQSPTQKERVIILEVNTLPALTPATALFHQAAELGIMPTDFIDMIIALGLETHAHCRPEYRVQSEEEILQQVSSHLIQSRLNQKIDKSV